MGAVDGHPQPWNCADESLAYDLSFLFEDFAWMNQEIVSGGLFAAP
jgi:hypothetical protein